VNVIVGKDGLGKVEVRRERFSELCIYGHQFAP